jgi:hypothetical protein
LDAKKKYCVSTWLWYMVHLLSTLVQYSNDRWQPYLCTAGTTHVVSLRYAYVVLFICMLSGFLSPTFSLLMCLLLVVFISVFGSFRQCPRKVSIISPTDRQHHSHSKMTRSLLLDESKSLKCVPYMKTRNEKHYLMYIYASCFSFFCV